jgi:hypothetical protein
MNKPRKVVLSGKMREIPAEERRKIVGGNELWNVAPGDTAINTVNNLFGGSWSKSGPLSVWTRWPGL